MEPPAVISLDEVRFSYSAHGHPADGFGIAVGSMRISAGERVAIIGPSGSGKTTLLHLIAGVLRPHSGRVEVLGTDISTLPDAKRRAMRLERIGMIFQEFELLEYLTALENITLSARLGPSLPNTRGMPVAARALELARIAGVEHVLHRKPRALSQGERQRIAICRALVTSPGVLLCDEPTGNLDPANTRAILHMLTDRASIGNASVIMVTHNHQSLDRFDRVIDSATFAARAATTTQTSGAA